MSEFQIEYVYAGIAVCTAAIAVIGFFYKRGKKEGIDESCAKRIEGMLVTLSRKLDQEIKNTDESHRQMHEKINGLRSELAYIKGVVDNHIESKTD